MDVIQQREIELHTEPTGPEGESRQVGQGLWMAASQRFSANSERESSGGSQDSSTLTLGLSEDTSQASES